MAFVLRLFLLALLAGYGSSIQCFTSTNCSGNVLESLKRKECCIGDGFSYDDGECNDCIVHGFIHDVDEVTEGESKSTLFKLNVKGMTNFTSDLIPLDLVGTIRGKSNESYYEEYQEKIQVNIGEPCANISIITTDDDIALEYHERIILTFTPSSSLSLLIHFLSHYNEYIRDTMVINIVDADLLDIHFNESYYSIEEGSSMPSIFLVFTTNQEEFNITFRAVSIGTAEAEGVGFFINSSAIAHSSRATEGSDFSSFTEFATVNNHSSYYKLMVNFNVNDDMMPEEKESFALIAEIHVLSDNLTCFQTSNGEAQCPRHKGATEIRINDANLCTREEPVRVNGITREEYAEGIVQVCVNDRWGLVCDDGWNNHSAMVVCKQLGYTTGGKLEDGMCAETNGTIVLDDVVCNGKEPSLLQCGHNNATHNCILAEAARVKCHNQEGLPSRLVNGTNKSGIVEVFYEQQWWSICDDYWTDVEANVVCGQLNFLSFGANAMLMGEFTSAPFLLDNVNCVGNETSLEQCEHDTTHDCGSNEKAGVTCIDDSDIGIRLSNITSPTSGFIELKYRNEWRSVCGDHWTIDDASVACRELGFSLQGATAQFQEYDGEYWLDDVKCQGKESYLFACQHVGFGKANCTTRERAGVTCKGPRDRTARQALDGEACEFEGETRLVREDSTLGDSEGSVEICIDRQWGAVCDDGWDVNAAMVVCKEHDLLTEANFMVAIPITMLTHPKRSSMHYLLDDVRCNGTESSLLDCKHSEPGVHNCGLKERAGVICTNVSRPVVPTIGLKILGVSQYPGNKSNAMSANATIIGEGIRGTVMFIPMEGDKIMVDLDILGLDDSAEYDWGIRDNVHQMNTERSSTFDPYNAMDRSCNYMKDCNTSSENCAVGDYSGRFGMLHGNERRMEMETKTELKDILMKTVFVSNGSSNNVATGRIYPTFECEEGSVQMTVVAQSALLGPIEFCVHNEWHRVVDEKWTRENATSTCWQLELPYRGAVAVYFNEPDVLLKSQGRNVIDTTMHMVSRAVRESDKVAGVLCQDETSDEN